MDQKSAGIKAAPAPAASRAFLLWMALLLLYFLILPSAAHSGRPAGAAQGARAPMAAAAAPARRAESVAESAAPAAALD